MKVHPLLVFVCLLTSALADSAYRFEDEVIPEMNGFKAVRVRKVEPDGLKIIHEVGNTKIPIEKLTEDQRAKYGLTLEQAAEYRKQSAASTAAAYAGEQQRAAVPSEPAKPVAKFITADQVKVMWVRKLPQPRSLDPNYSKILETYRDFIGEIRAGKRDLDAQETAATYNKAKALEIGNTEMASTYEAELGRISLAKSAAAELAQREKQARRERSDFAMLNSQLGSIDRNLRDIRNTVQGW